MADPQTNWWGDPLLYPNPPFRPADSDWPYQLTSLRDTNWLPKQMMCAIRSKTSHWWLDKLRCLQHHKTDWRIHTAAMFSCKVLKLFFLIVFWTLLTCSNENKKLVYQHREHVLKVLRRIGHLSIYSSITIWANPLIKNVRCCQKLRQQASRLRLSWNCLVNFCFQGQAKVLLVCLLKKILIMLIKLILMA